MMARMDNGSISSCFWLYRSHHILHDDDMTSIDDILFVAWCRMHSIANKNRQCHRSSVPIDCCLYCCILYCCTLLLHQFKQSETTFSHQYIVNPIGIGNYCGSCSWCSCCWIWCTQQYAAPSSTAVHCIELYIPYYTVLASNHNIEWLSSRYNWNKPRPDVISCAGCACCDASAAARWREQVIVHLIF